MTLTFSTMSGFEQEVESIAEAKEVLCKRRFECSPSEVITRESGDGETVYFYESEADADNDKDGAYTPQVTRERQ